MEAAVSGINALGETYGFRPAMIVPAIVLNRHRGLLQYAANSSLEFAIHGYTHRNHRPWSFEKQTDEVAKAKAVFDELAMPYCGFRAPYLSCNDETNDVLEASGMLWNSDKGIMWPYDCGAKTEKDGYALNEALDFLYAPANAEQTLALPRMHGSMACIPLVFPDDEILVDRRGIEDQNQIAKIWLDVLDQVYARGEAFVLQFHPERYTFCRKGMDALLAYMADSEKRFWVTDMRKLAEWWRARSMFSFTVSETIGGAFEVECACSERAVVLVRNVPDLSAPFHCGYDRIEETSFRLKTGGIKPCVGIHPQCGPAVQGFIKELGFAYESTESDAGYSVFFDEDTIYSEEEEVEILHRIEQSGQPLVRYWPWPDGYQSAFATSHDLDCMTLGDFVWRTLGW